jgi:hypothetical protein
MGEIVDRVVFGARRAERSWEEFGKAISARNLRQVRSAQGDGRGRAGGRWRRGTFEFGRLDHDGTRGEGDAASFDRRIDRA